MRIFAKKNMQFQQILGQTEAKEHILSAMQHDKLPHALLLCGAEGIGKLAFATAIAQYANCMQPLANDSCGKCANCQRSSQGIHPDISFVLPIMSKEEKGKHVLSDAYMGDFRKSFLQDPYFSLEQWQTFLDGANKQLMISVHEMREAKRKLLLKSFSAKFKILIVWNAELVNEKGANAFLKILEEPPERTLILMTTSQPSRLLPTIISRCQRLFLQKLSQTEIAAGLQQFNGLSLTQAQQIAAIADGSMVNARGYLEESGVALTSMYEHWMRANYAGNYVKMNETIEKVYKASKEFQRAFLRLAIKKMRDSLLFHLNVPQLALVTEEDKIFHQNFGTKVMSVPKAEMMLQETENALRYIAGNGNSQMVFMALSLRLFGILRG